MGNVTYQEAVELVYRSDSADWVRANPERTCAILAGLVDTINGMGRQTVNGLTWAERSALTHLLTQAPADEPFVIKGREVAAKSQVSPSTLTAMIRKLRAAGLIEARALGTNGMWIRIPERLRLAAME